MRKILFSIVFAITLISCGEKGAPIDSDVYEFEIEVINVYDEDINVDLNNDVGWYSITINKTDKQIYTYLKEYKEEGKTNKAYLYFKKDYKFPTEQIGMSAFNISPKYIEDKKGAVLGKKEVADVEVKVLSQERYARIYMEGKSGNKDCFAYFSLQDNEDVYEMLQEYMKGDRKSVLRMYFNEGDGLYNEDNKTNNFYEVSPLYIEEIK